MIKINDLYKEIVTESDISKHTDVINYKLKYKNYLCIIKKYNLVYNQETKRFDCDNEIDCEEDLVKNGKFIIPFGVINGYFVCADYELTSLENCPIEVHGDFDCSENNLTSLEHCPKKINGNFCCVGNLLTSLKYCPEIVNGDFDCTYNQLTSLEHCPKKVYGDFCCTGNQITSLKYCPKIVNGDFNCSQNNIKDFSINCKIKGDFYHD